MSDFPGNQPPITVTTQPKAANRLARQHLWQVGLRHHLNRYLGILVKIVRRMKKKDRSIMPKQISELRRVEPTRCVISMTEKKRLSGAASCTCDQFRLF